MIRNTWTLNMETFNLITVLFCLLAIPIYLISINKFKHKEMELTRIFRIKLLLAILYPITFALNLILIFTDYNNKTYRTIFIIMFFILQYYANNFKQDLTKTNLNSTTTE